MEKNNHLENPKNYRKDSCYYCRHFLSYANCYNDNTDFVDLGKCTKKCPYEHTNYSLSCNEFEYNEKKLYFELF